MPNRDTGALQTGAIEQALREGETYGGIDDDCAYGDEQVGAAATNEKVARGAEPASDCEPDL